LFIDIYVVNGIIEIMSTVINKSSYVHFGGRIPEQTHMAAKRFAIEHGVTLNRFYNEALLTYIKEQSHRGEPSANAND